jgi:hypothetical protein
MSKQEIPKSSNTSMQENKVVKSEKSARKTSRAVLQQQQDMIGRKFGSWTVISLFPGEFHNTRYYCKCSCGTEKDVCGVSLRRGLSLRCAKCKHRNKIKHGMAHTKIYASWCAMIKRCNNPNATQYKDYGGRGIKVCDRWLKFDNFYEDMGDRPKGFQIDRIDNDLGYSKENCQWVTPKENSNNRRKRKKETN